MSLSVPPPPPADCIKAINGTNRDTEDLLETRLRSARLAHEALFGRSRGVSSKLPPPPTWVTEGLGPAPDLALEHPVSSTPSAIPESPHKPWRAVLSSPHGAPSMRSDSRPHTPLLGEGFGTRLAPPPVPSFPGLHGAARRSESVPVAPTTQFMLVPSVTPVAVMTPLSSPRVLDQYRLDVNTSRAAVESCRMLAEAGKAAAVSVASEAARRAEQRITEEMQQRHKGLEAENQQLRMEMARLQDQLRAHGGLHDELRLFKEKHLECEAQLGQLMSERDINASQAVMQLNNELNETRSQITMLETERCQLASENSRLHNSGVQQEQAVLNLRQELNSVRHLQQELEALKAERDASMMHAKLQSEDQIEALRREVQVAETMREQLIAENADLRGLQRTWEESTEGLQRFNQSQEERHNETLHAVRREHDETLSQAKADHHLELEALRRRLSSAGREHDQEIHVMRRRLSETGNQSGIEIDTLRRENEQLRSDFSHLKNAADQKDQTINSLRHALEESMAASQGSFEEIQLQLQAVTLERDQLYSDMASLRQKGDEERNTIRLLRRELDLANAEKESNAARAKLEADAARVRSLRKESITSDAKISNGGSLLSGQTVSESIRSARADSDELVAYIDGDSVRAPSRSPAAPLQGDSFPLQRGSQQQQQQQYIVNIDLTDDQEIEIDDPGVEPFEVDLTDDSEVQVSPVVHGSTNGRVSVENFRGHRGRLRSAQVE